MVSDTETVRVILARRSIRIFTSREVSDRDLTTILRAANQAPSAHNLQSWRLFVVRGMSKLQLVALAREKANAFPRPASTLLRMAAKSISSAPVVIIVVNSGKFERPGALTFGQFAGVNNFFSTMEIQSSSAAVQNMLLAAESLGLASVWLGILSLLKEEIFLLTGDGKGEFLAVVPIGYALGTPGPLNKKPLEHVVSFLD